MPPSSRGPVSYRTAVADIRGWLARIGREVLQRLRDRTDSEHEQAAIRLVLASLVVAYLGVYYSRQDSLDGTEIAVAWLAVAILTFSVVILVAIIAEPRQSVLRRVVGNLADIGTTSACMTLTGEAGAPLFTIYLWVTLGNGLRYGPRYLYLSASLSFLGFLGVVVFSPYWSAHPPLAIGLLLGLILIPAYAASLVRKLERARRKAEEASQAKSRFLANVSHEMRTPLTGVIGMLDIMLGTRLEARQQEMVLTAQAAAQMMLSLINEVLDIAKIEAGKVELKRIDFDLYRLVAETARVFSADAARKGLAFTSSVSPAAPCRVRGDPERLREVLINLIGNAIKFTEHGQVGLRVRLAHDDEARARVAFEVEDTGIGIPPEAIDRIFAPFEQADDSITRRYGGTGLGTAIARQLVELMGGAIGVESQEGVGSRFWFEVPLEKRPEPEDVLQGIDDTAILVLGADGPVAARLRQRLALWQLEPHWEAPAAPAIARLVSAARQGHPYRALIVDESCVEMPADQLARILRTERSTRDTYLILLAEGSRPLDRLDGYSVVLPDPLNETLLFHALHDAFSLAGPAGVASVMRHREALARGRPLRVLLADDTPLNLKVVGEYLARAGHSVHLVDGGDAALEALTSGVYDAVVLDMHMPDVSGLDVLRAYRFMQPTGRKVPIIMLSADVTAAARAEAERLGADAYLTKPVVSSQLLSTLDALTALATPVSSPMSRAAPEAGAVVPADPGVELGAPLLDAQQVADLRSLRPGPDFLQGLLAEFRQASSAALAALRQAHAEGDFARFRDIAHALQGSAGDMGAVRAARLCRQARALFPATFRESVPPLLEALASTLEETHAALSRLTSGPAGAAPEKSPHPRARSGPGRGSASPPGAGPAP